MKRDLFNGSGAEKVEQPKVNVDRERGLIDENGGLVIQHFNMHVIG